MYTLKSGYTPKPNLPRTITDAEYYDMNEIDQVAYERGGIQFTNDPDDKEDTYMAAGVDLFNNPIDFSAADTSYNTPPPDTTSFDGFGGGDFGGGGSSDSF